MSLLHTCLSDISEPDLIALVQEMKEVTMARSDPGLMLMHFLQSCHHPLGSSEKWLPIQKSQITPGRFLDRKIRKLSSPPILQLCEEVARMKGLSLEAVEGMSLYIFFNRHTPHLLRKERKKPHDPRDTLRRLGY